MLMSKLDQLFNEYYRTEGITVTEHLKAMLSEINKEEMSEELTNLFDYLNKELA